MILTTPRRAGAVELHHLGGRYLGTVTDIIAYGRALRVLSSGMTAELRVELVDGALPLLVPSTWWVRPRPSTSALPGKGGRAVVG